MSDSTLPAPDPEERARFAELRADPTPARRNELVLRYTSIAEALARRFVNRGEPLEDLVQVATFALIKAVDRYDPERGIPFAGFAVPTILGELKRHFRDHGWSGSVRRSVKELLVRVRAAGEELEAIHGRAPRPAELAEHLGVSVDDIIEALEAGQWYRADSLSAIEDATGGQPAGAVGPGGGLETDTTREALDRVLVSSLLSQLPPREQRILVLRYFEERSQDQIALELGISQMHVSRLLRRSLEQLSALARAEP